ncbi:rhomboid family intramembrane serine protease [Flavobacterium amniphilum]|uniref:rhomboid family intramembrane serine protease n=1 Tax=Flavobacterium amniphilum TaxID=1834035 RepID=UPI002029D66E|nr:rhomboid family intramembrane serine protease [Flavobacterium amniphilum]MCL9805046.1 rhomboid family intramembrane serine protease [Flavobacterium amniphilum]
MMQITPTVKQLLIINILFFVGSQILKDLAYVNLSLYYFENPLFRPWQLITHMFMHAGIYQPGTTGNLSHLFFNMFALFSFGSLLESIWGSKKFLFFYLSAGLGAALFQLGVNYYMIHSALNEVSGLNLSQNDINTILSMDFRTVFNEDGQMVAGKINDILSNANCTQEQFDVIAKAILLFQTPMVGASGAIYGLLVAFAFILPNAQLSLMFIPIPIKAKYFVPIYMLLYDGFFGILGNSFMGINTGVAHFAHIGGALIGLMMMWYWKKNSFNNRRWN